SRSRRRVIVCVEARNLEFLFLWVQESCDVEDGPGRCPTPAQEVDRRRDADDPHWDRGGHRIRCASRNIVERCYPGGIVRNPEGRAGWNFGDAPRIQQIWINRTSVGNAILVDQRRFVDDKVRCLVTAGFGWRGGPEVRNEYSDQRGRQCRTTHSCLPSTNEMRCSTFDAEGCERKPAASSAGQFGARGLVPSMSLGPASG